MAALFAVAAPVCTFLSVVVAGVVAAAVAPAFLDIDGVAVAGQTLRRVHYCHCFASSWLTANTMETNRLCLDR